jgi:hypothetical protein
MAEGGSIVEEGNETEITLKVDPNTFGQKITFALGNSEVSTAVAVN